MNRKIFTIIFVLFVLMFLPKPARAAEATLSLSGTGAQTVGASFNVEVVVNPNGTAMCGVNFDLNYPANIVSLNGTPIVPSSFTVPPGAGDIGTSGRISYHIGLLGCPTSSATILTIPFKANVAGTASLTFANYRVLGGPNGDLIFSTTTSGAGILVSEAAATGQPSTETGSSAKKPVTKKPTASGQAETLSTTANTASTVSTTAETNSTSAESTTAASTVPEPKSEIPKTNSLTKFLVLGGIGLLTAGVVVGLLYISHRRRLKAPVQQNFISDNAEQAINSELTVNRESQNPVAASEEPSAQETQPTTNGNLLVAQKTEAVTSSLAFVNQNIAAANKPAVVSNGWDEILGTEPSEETSPKIDTTESQAKETAPSDSASVAGASTVSNQTPAPNVVPTVSNQAPVAENTNTNGAAHDPGADSNWVAK